MFGKKTSLAKRRLLGALLACVPVAAGLYTAAVHAQQTAAVSPASSNRVHIKSRVFHLPIRIDRASLPKVREVHLYMKEGQGEWIRKDTVAPGTESFRCLVPSDGEFSFAVVTIDNLGNSYPADIANAAPAMTVVVETQPRDTAIVSADPTPLPPPTSAPSPASPTIVEGSGPSISGGVSAVPSGPVVINGSVPATTVSNTRPAVSQVVQATPVATPMPTPPAAVTPPPIATPLPSAPPMPTAAPPSAPVPPPFETVAAPTFGASQPTVQPAVQATTHIQATQPCPSTSAKCSAGVCPTAQAPNRQILNTARVGIDYNVGRVGPSGLSRVEVWATQDQGRTWQRMGEDADQRSPAEVDLPGEGVFGIRLVGVNGNGFGGKAPVGGDAPSTTIEVDLTSPTVHTFDVDSVSKGGMLDIRWRVSDKNLTAEPINLFYATQRTGPWLPIAFKTKNDGIFRWTLPRDVPTQLFFRIEACDAAGNVARSETPNPVMLDMTEPDVNVIGITAMPQRVANTTPTTPGN